MQHTNILRTFLLICSLHFGVQAQAETFLFDLAGSIGPDFVAFPEAVIDLGIKFKAIESASIELSGVFLPGQVTPVTIPEFTGPILPSDTVNIIVRLGEVGTAWIDKDVYAIQTLVGYQGDVAFSLPLAGVENPQSSIPFLFPSGNASPEYTFLLDGKFGLSIGTTHFLASNLHELVPPQFNWNSFILRVEATAIPEPATSICALVAAAFITGRRGWPKVR